MVRIFLLFEFACLWGKMRTILDLEMGFRWLICFCWQQSCLEYNNRGDYSSKLKMFSSF